MENQLSQSLLGAEDAYKKKNYLKSYSIYKSIYRKYNLINILLRLIDIAYISLKQTNTKLNLISNLITLGFNKNDDHKILFIQSLDIFIIY